MVAEKLELLKSVNQLELTGEEEKTILDFFNFIEADEKKLQDYDTDNIIRMVHCMPVVNMLREDKNEKLFSREDLLKRAPEQSDGYWQVPRILE